ncbi:GTPase HflX [Allofrancisella guangzhouensis]|uniref:GTPase HflX n=1 Tax=Allofrancisella guangzhouensis TaxID=594679 RepID=A0A0A8E4C8_9GAMM|nr:ribosome rescue GTPase HflX [Allofrancisella guangzhouensis]AJC48819.1 GTPase HflX [Allofrancisella guangzhouensis]MBK2027284.1 GTPase HflX [Allofrancisella guangzhouensis]MBK2044738.1 GTPase HflX [Allofrancisella guangzhouensis]MBK2045920.1 GTPase HflX [Allofrancisella guangzhouensis]
MEFFQSYDAGSKCLLVNINFKYRRELNADAVELKGLVLAADKVVLDSLDFNHPEPDIKYFCGMGKMEMIKNKRDEIEADLVIFNHPLSPSQERNIEKYLECKIMDRTRLILEIFSLRAKTHEGKLQVELAQLNYQSTRLVKGWTHLERQKGGIGVRGGPGETQLEIDRRLIRQRIKQITQKLEKVKHHRDLSRSSRRKNNIPTISFVGYTNAGKSTLFNKLTNAQVLVKDQLFATLDPTLRKVSIPKLGEVIFSDTVGFIKNLPHDLVEAFHATLEEAIESDLLVHVIDYADEGYKSYIEQVNKVLNEIGIGDKEKICVYNKIDKLESIRPNFVAVDNSEESVIARVYLSAVTGEGLDEFYTALATFFNKSWFKGTLELPSKYSKIRSMMYDLGVIEKEQISEEGNYILDIIISEPDFERFNREFELDLQQFLV